MTAAIALLVVLVLIEAVRLYSQHQLVKQVIAEQHVLYRQQKSVGRDSERTRREAVKALEKAHAVRDDAALLYARVDRTLADRGLQRVLTDQE